MKKSEVRRWHFWWCFQGEDREKEALACIEELKAKGFKAKIWAPLPQHKTSGHVHVVVLCAPKELFRQLGIE